MTDFHFKLLISFLLVTGIIGSFPVSNAYEAMEVIGVSMLTMAYLLHKPVTHESIFK